MSVFVRNLTINVKTDFREDLELTSAGGGPVNLTGYSGASHIRKHTDSGLSAVMAVGITSAADGKIRVSYGATQTGELTEGRYVYDIETTASDSTVTRVLQGTVTVSPNVTR